jgi:Ca2+-binding EF-hand superfamily protein
VRQALREVGGLGGEADLRRAQTGSASIHMARAEEAMIAAADTNGDGRLSYKEFVEFVNAL